LDASVAGEFNSIIGAEAGEKSMLRTFGCSRSRVDRRTTGTSPPDIDELRLREDPSIDNDRLDFIVNNKKFNRAVLNPNY